MGLEADNRIVTFFETPLLNRSKTRKEGDKVYDLTLMVKVIIPGQVDHVERPATDQDKLDFAKSYEAFKKGVEVQPDGTDIRHWPQLTGGELKMLLALQITTIEALADLPDSMLHRLGQGAQGMKQRAIKYLEHQKGVAALHEENQKLKERLARLEASRDVVESIPATPAIPALKSKGQSIGQKGAVGGATVTPSDKTDKSQVVRNLRIN